MGIIQGIITNKTYNISEPPRMSNPPSTNLSGGTRRLQKKIRLSCAREKMSLVLFKMHLRCLI